MPNNSRPDKRAELTRQSINSNSPGDMFQEIASQKGENSETIDKALLAKGDLPLEFNLRLTDDQLS